MTLTELKNKADDILTPLWDTVYDQQTKYYAANNTYRAVSVRKLHIPAVDKFDVWARIQADSKGFSLQVLVEKSGIQYARAKGHGTGTTFDWKMVLTEELGTDGEYSGPPKTFKITNDYLFCF